MWVHEATGEVRLTKPDVEEDMNRMIEDLAKKKERLRSKTAARRTK